MKYSKSNSEYFRNKKGGGLETNGKLNSANFSSNENNKLRVNNHRKNTTTFELPEMNSSEMNSSENYKIKPIKIMVKKKSGFKKLFRRLASDEHYIFFWI